MISRDTPTTHPTCDQAGFRWRNRDMREMLPFLIKSPSCRSLEHLPTFVFPLFHPGGCMYSPVMQTGRISDAPQCLHDMS